ncbi:EXPERA domain-containing protein [Mycolicibacterium vaccae]|uniref:EXPERA domain-containing protein n=1 Tax=Mycolicibacterium vaccae TaxID=1810 RepID=UPI003D05994D
MADSLGAEAAREPVVPLRARRRDWFFIAVFTIFAATSFLMDTVNLFGRPDSNSRWIMARYIYNNYAAGTDPMLIANPRFVQIGTGFVSALIFGLFYLVLIYAFVRGRDWIRLPSVFYAGMITANTILYLGVGLFGDAPLFNYACGQECDGFDYAFANAPKVLAYNGPYIIVALLLVARMWKPKPFTGDTRSTG